MFRAPLHKRLCALALVGGAVVALAWRAGPAAWVRAEVVAEARPAISGPEISATVSGAGRSVGATSCSARACHGSVGPAAAEVLRNEYTTWLTADAHSEAYTTLVRNPLSRSIAEKLGKASGKVIPAHEDTRCLACHAEAGASPRRPQLAEGVGCESCHGAARDWLAPHTSAAWQKLSSAEKHARGMLDTHDPAARARICTGCHVGAPADEMHGLPTRDVNHDLIAAGHPRMDFELAAFLEAMPHHWADNRRETSLTAKARLWAAGQVELANASLRLLEDRARQPARPWPELAELDCFACHHDLRGQGSSTTQGGNKRAPGSPVWSEWPFAALPAALALAGASKSAPGPDYESFQAALQDLDNMMSRIEPDRARVAVQAKDLAGRLAPWSERLANAPCEPATIATILRYLIKDQPRDDSPRWMTRVQRYLAARALYPVLVKQDPAFRSEQVESYLERNAAALAFPKGYDSPAVRGDR